MLAVKDSVGVPVGSVQQGALVLVQAGDGGPAPVVEDTGAVDEDVAVVADNDAVCVVLDLDVVATLLGVPVGTDDLVLELDVLAQVVLGGKALEVVKDVLGGRVDGGPVELGLERPGVVVRGNIAGAAGSLLEIFTKEKKKKQVVADLPHAVQLTQGICSRTMCRRRQGSSRKQSG